jgi:lytic murein transglycosylase
MTYLTFIIARNATDNFMHSLRTRWRFALVGLGLASLVWSVPALAVDCQSGGSFDAWLEAFKREAATQGISQPTLTSALSGLSYDPNVIARDRGQQVFQQTFEEFSGRMISPERMRKGSNMLKQYAGTFVRIEEQFGVQGPVLVAIWGLETDFGTNVGKYATIRSLATLAYDCRRSDKFSAELMDALRIVDRGDLTPAEMHGAWAGEIGQTQFLPSSYMKFAIDFDGNGKRDLIHSAPDALASTANYLKGYGWKAGQPWTPGSANFDVLQQWNKSEVYSKTVAAFATKLDQAP